MTPIRRLYLRLYRGVGKEYDIDAAVPDRTLAWSLVLRMVELCRGLLRFRRVVFIGSRVRVRARRGVHLSRGVTIEAGCRLDGLSHDGVWLGERVKLGSGTVVVSTGHLSKVGKGLRLGRDSSCGEWCYFGAAGGITVGNDVIMGQLVSFHAQQHDLDDPESLIRTGTTRETGIEVGDGTWIGAKATLLDGAKVGAGSVVAAGAVVRGAHPPGVVLAGVPAKVIRQR